MNRIATQRTRALLSLSRKGFANQTQLVNWETSQPAAQGTVDDCKYPRPCDDTDRPPGHQDG